MLYTFIKKTYTFLSLFFALFCSHAVMAQSSGTWTQTTMVSFPINGVGQPTGIGRVSFVAFHPTDANTIYAVSASGGLWKTTSGGKSWANLNTDFLPQTSCASVSIDPNNPNVIYLGTGDSNYDYNGYGVWKSTDGGQTWLQSTSGIGNKLVNEILISPSNTNILFAACSDGIYKSTNAGASWIRKTTVNDLTYRDIAFNTAAGSQIMYACSDEKFFISTNFGETWADITLSANIKAPNYPTEPINSMRLAVTPANPNYVYVVAGVYNTRTFAGLFRSTNGGTTFTRMSNAADPPTVAQPNILGYDNTDGTDPGGQGSYNLCIVAHPTDVNTVYVGSHNIWKTTDGGTSWQLRSCWGCGATNGTHTDIHHLIFSPFANSPKQLYIASDGGVSRTTDAADNVYEACSDGLAATEFYNFGQSPIYKEYVLAGTQDNGLQYYLKNKTITINGGDWTTDFEFDKFDYQTAYTYSDVSEIVADSTTGNYSWEDPFCDYDPANNNFFQHPTNGNVMFGYYTHLNRTTNLKTTPLSDITWTDITSTANPTNAEIMALSVSKPNANLLYFTLDNDKFVRSANALAATPTYTIANLPSGSSAYYRAAIEPHPTNENIVWASFEEQIYKSTNKGTNWTAITGNLPGYNIRKIIFDPSNTTNNGIYVATYEGVYYRDDTMSNWIRFSEGMPTVCEITDMEIFYDGTPNSILRVSTYGRGIWQSNLYSATATMPTADFIYNTSNQNIGGNQGPTDPCAKVYLLTDRSMGKPTAWQWAITPTSGFVFLNGTNANSKNPQIELNNAGLYTVQLTVSNAQGNSSKTTTFYNAQLTSAPSCTPTYTQGTYAGDYISNVTLASISNSTGGASSPYYTEYDCQNTTLLNKGQAYGLTIGFGGDSHQYCGAWIDYNQNNAFETTEFIGGNTTAVGAYGSYTISFTVPITAATGIARLRIRGGDDAAVTATKSCGASSSGYGESEDYALVIPSNCIPPQPIVTGTAIVCDNQQGTYAVTAVVGNTYLWTVTGGAITAGQGTNQITVTWNPGATGTVVVTQTTP